MQKNPAAKPRDFLKCLFHQQHLPRTLDRAVQTPLVMRGQAGVFPRQNAALIGHKLLQQVGVLKVQGVNGEVDLGLRPGGPRLD